MSSATWLPPSASKILARTPAAKWQHFAVVLDSEGTDRLVTRGELAAELRAGDLHALAREVETRRVPRGSMLVVGISDADGPIVRVLRAR